MQRPYNQEKYDVQITVCPYDLTKQKQTLLAILNHLSNQLDDAMREDVSGLLNLINYIENEVKFRDDKE